MSVVTCTVTDKVIRFISDTQVTQGSFKRTSFGTKLFITPSAVVGFCGSSCFSLLLKEVLRKNPFSGFENEHILNFIDVVREEASERGMVYSNDEVNALPLIVASKDRAYVIFGYTVFPIDDFEAIGSDADIAFGLMASGIQDIYTVKNICDLSIYCSPPFEVIEIERGTGKVTGDILNHNLVAMESFGSQIDYTEPPDDEGVFSPHSDFDFTIIPQSERQPEDEDLEFVFSSPIV